MRRRFFTKCRRTEILIARSVPEMPEITVKLEDLTASSFIRDERFRCPKCGAEMLYRRQRTGFG
jgi:hypothetical protein